MKYLLKNGTVISGAGTRKQDVLVEGEKIIKVGEDLSQPDAKVVDVSGKLLFPGFIDGHTHFDLEVAGTVTADDFETGTRAAILGGTTLVIDFASQDKGGHTLKEGLEKWHKKADGKCSCDYSFHMSIVEWNEETKKEIQDMINEGITSFKLYMTYPAMIVDDEDLYKIIKALNEKGCFAGVHCENAGVIDALIQEAKAQGKLGPGESSSCTSGYYGGRGSTPSSCNCEGSRSSGHGGTFDQPQGIRRNRPCPGKWSDRICRDLSSVSSSGRQRLFQT